MGQGKYDSLAGRETGLDMLVTMYGDGVVDLLTAEVRQPKALQPVRCVPGVDLSTRRSNFQPWRPGVTRC